MPNGTTSSPLVEPDVRVSLIRLSQQHSPEAVAGSCTVSAQRYCKPNLHFSQNV
jgi:hypothetical protein